MFITKKKLNTMIEAAVKEEREKHYIDEQFNGVYQRFLDMERVFDERFRELERAIVANASN